MTIELITQPAPALDPAIEQELYSMYPRHFLRWNPRHQKVGEKWEGRWEIWIELAEVAHPDFKHFVDHDKDVWNTDAQCWMRRLQAYTYEDGSFAPADERLLIGLEMADTWSNRRFFEDHVEEPHSRKEEEATRHIRDISAGSANYYRRIDSPIVGRHVNSGWRWRIQ